MSEFNDDVLGSISITSKNKMSGKVKVIGSKEEDLNSVIIIKRMNEIASNIEVYSDNIIDSNGKPGNQIRSVLSVPHHDQINGNIGVYSDNIIDDSGKYGKQLKTFLSVPHHNQINGTISVRPHNRMRIVAEIIEPPSTQLKVTKIKEALIMSSMPTLNYSNNLNTLVGKKNQDVYRTLMKIDINDIPSINQIITKSSLILNKENYTQSYGIVEVYEILEPWDTAGVTWVNQPKIGSKIASSQVGLNPGKINIDIIDLVKDWYLKNKENNGIMLKTYTADGSSLKLKELTTEESYQFSTSNSTKNYPIVDVEYFDESMTNSVGLSKIPSTLSVQRSNKSEISSSLFVNSDWGKNELLSSLTVPQYDDNNNLVSSITARISNVNAIPFKLITSVPFINGSINVFNLNEIESSIIVRRSGDSKLTSNVVIRQKDNNDLQCSLEIQFKNKDENLESSIVVSKPNLLSTISTKVHDNLNSSLSVSRKDEKDLNSNLIISRPFLLGSIRASIASQLNSTISVRRDDFYELPSKFITSTPNLKGTIIVSPTNSLPSSIKVINDYINSSISVRKDDNEDLQSSITIKSFEDVELNSQIRVFNYSELQSNIEVIDPNISLPSSIKVIKGSIDSSIIVRRDLYDDLQSNIIARVLDVEELDSSINVCNTYDLSSSIGVFIPWSNLDSSINVLNRVDIPSNLTVFIPISNIPSSIKVIKGSIDSSIIVRQDAYNELQSSVIARVLDVEELDSSISVHNTSDLLSNLGVSETSELISTITVVSNNNDEIYVFIL